VPPRTRIVYSADPAPPDLACPSCADFLLYQHTAISGVPPERWDLFTCAACGQFEYRHRTRRLRHVIDVSAVHRVMGRLPPPGKA